MTHGCSDPLNTTRRGFDGVNLEEHHCAENGHHLVDVGTSGGIWGITESFGLSGDETLAEPARGQAGAASRVHRRAALKVR